MSALNSSSSSKPSTAQASIHEGLIEYISSTDGQLNEAVPPELLTSGQLVRILDKGILSTAAMTEQSSSYQGGYDVGTSRVVFLNVITKEAGVVRAIYSPADGAFSVGMERANDYTWIQSILDQDDIDKIFQERFSDVQSSDFLYPLVKDQAVDEHLKRNPKFLGELTKRVNRLVILVLDLPTSGSDSLTDPSGCHDATRKEVPPEAIKMIVAGQDLEDASEVGFVASKKIRPVVFAPTKEQKVTYVYEKPSSLGIEKREVTVVIKAPDFGAVLQKVFQTSFSAGKPMFLHVTRL